MSKTEMSPQILGRRDCPRVHYTYDEQIPGVNLLVPWPGTGTEIGSTLKPKEKASSGDSSYNQK